jgi:hypothetical protein
MASRLINRILHHSRDQLCSLAFPLGNIYFIACSYAGGFGTHSFQKCSRPTLWGVPFFLGALPFLARFGQSIRRWWDSGSITHLINVRLLTPFRLWIRQIFSLLYVQAGKYLTGIAFYVCYQLWRHNGGWYLSQQFDLVVKADGISRRTRHELHILLPPWNNLFNI